MCHSKITSEDYDGLRSDILDAGGKLELLVYGRREGETISVGPTSDYLLDDSVSDVLADAVSRHFEGKGDGYRLTTKFALEVLPEVPGIFLAYYEEDYLLELQRETYEVPRQILLLVEFLEDAYQARVEFRFGEDPLHPFEGSEFILRHVADMGGADIEVHGSQDASPSIGFIRRVGGEYLVREMATDSFPDGGFFCADLKLERDNYGVRHFRMFYKGQRFFSIERDKLVEDKT